MKRVFIFFTICRCFPAAVTGQTMILTRYPSMTDVPPLYEGRASLALDIAKGKADLKLSSITLQDNKVFSCRVQIPGDDEGKLVDSVRLVVLGNFCLLRISRLND